MFNIEEHFELKWEKYISELKYKALLYVYRPNGAEILIIECDDNDKAFGVAFKTLPEDNTGVAHILEHSVFGGTKKYPVKGIIDQLLKGSLATYVNASTFPDKTVYPISSQNEKDFYNLASVYFDMVFNPTLEEKDFMQEGWHLELNKPEDELKIKGIVFNEMKAVYSDAESLQEEAIFNNLNPDNVYKFESGGNPEYIIDLTHKQLKDFHKKYYTATNAKIFFYGNAATEKNLEFIHNLLKELPKTDKTKEVSDQPAFQKRKRFVNKYPVSESSDVSKKSYITLNWQINPENETDLMGLNILSYILLYSDAVPLKKALLESEIGEDITGIGYESDIKQPIFSVGLSNMRIEDEENLINIIEGTLTNLAENGIDKKLIEAAISVIEFHLRENEENGRGSKGITIFYRTLRSWLYDKSPLINIEFEESLNNIKELLKSQKYFENLIKRYLLSNNSSIIQIMQPDDSLNVERAKEEATKLAKIKDMMSAAEVEEVIATTKELTEYQQKEESEENLAKLPKLKIEDIDKKSSSIELEVLKDNELDLYLSPQTTNRIAYLTIGFNIEDFTEEEFKYLSLLSNVLLRLGTIDKSIEEFANQIDMELGALSADIYTSRNIDGTKENYLYLLSTKFLIQKTENFLKILNQVISRIDFNKKEKIKTYIIEEKAGIENNLIYSGHRVAASRAKASLSKQHYIDEITEGIEYLNFLRDLAGNFETRCEEIQSKLEEVYQKVFKGPKIILNFSSEKDDLATLKAKVSKELKSIGSRSYGENIKFETKFNDEAFIVPSDVSFSSMVSDLSRTDFKVHGSVDFINNILSMDYAWKKIRLQGGAYGGGASIDELYKYFAMISYRDPSIEKTLDVYKDVGIYIKERDLSQYEIQQYKIGAFGELDAPIPVSSLGFVAMSRYLKGITNELRQRMRDELFSADQQDFKKFGDYLDKITPDDIHLVVLGNKDKLKVLEKKGFEVKNLI